MDKLDFTTISGILEILSDSKEMIIKFFIVNSQAETIKFYVLGENACLIANKFFRSLDQIKFLHHAVKDYPYISIHFSRFLAIYRQLIEIGFSFELYENFRPGWKLLLNCSSGYTKQLEDFLEKNNTIENSFGVVVGFFFEKSKADFSIGAAFVDSNELTIKMVEFGDNATLCYLEALAVSERPKEALVFDSKDNKQMIASMKQILNFCGAVVTVNPLKEFDLDFARHSLSRLSTSSCIEFNEKKFALRGLSAALKYLESSKFILSDKNFEKKWRVENLIIESMFRMNLGAVKALNLFSNISDSHYNNEWSKYSSIFNFVNFCKTLLGKRKLRKLLVQPFIDKTTIEKRLDLVTIFINEGRVRENIRCSLQKVPDVHRLSKRLLLRSAQLQEIVSLYFFCKELPIMSSVISSCKDTVDFEKFSILNAFLIEPINSAHRDFTKFIDMVEQVVELEAVENHEYYIRPAINDQIKELSLQISCIKDDMEKEKNEICVALKNEKIKIQNIVQLGYHLTVPKSSVKKWEESKFTVLKTQKNLTRFTNSAFFTLSKKYKLLLTEYNKACNQIVQKLVEIASTFITVFDRVADSISTLDILCSFAHLVVEMKNKGKLYVRPTFVEHEPKKIKIANARHPLLENINESFIQNDVEMEKEKSHFQIITGPNMGGKSTYIRQIGIIVLMAQIGCYVPCDKCELTCISAIFARVGATDYQRKGISTFMSEMLEISHILQAANENSLLIIDELGRGTSTYDGFGLSMAISEKIAFDIKSFCLFATHFHEITRLEKIDNGVVNKCVSVECSGNNLRMLYKLEEGACDRSYGIHAAEIAGFPNEVLEDAKSIARKLERDASGIF